MRRAHTPSSTLGAPSGPPAASRGPLCSDYPSPLTPSAWRLATTGDSRGYELRSNPGGAVGITCRSPGFLICTMGQCPCRAILRKRCDKAGGA